MLTSPEAKLRGKMLETLDLQIEAAKAMLNGETFIRRAMRWVDDPETGERVRKEVTGSLFHTQGGLVVDSSARVLRKDGTPLPNLLAGGAAACGVSGSADWGHLSGNGLLTAVTLERIAGMSAVRLRVSS